MKYFILLGICFIGLIGPSRSNPDLTKAELMEEAAVEQKEGRYEDAFKIFIKLSELAKEHKIELSAAERKLFYNTYHFYYVLLLRKLVQAHNPIQENLIQQVSQKLTELFNDMPVIIENFRTNSADDGYNELKSFALKVFGDKNQFLAGFFPNSKSINPKLVDESTNNYEATINTYGRFVNHDDLSFIDVYFRLSKAYHFIDFLREKGNNRACSTAKMGHDLVVVASSDDNPNLVPLNQFLVTYCKNNEHHL